VVEGSAAEPKIRRRTKAVTEVVTALARPPCRTWRTWEDAMLEHLEQQKRLTGNQWRIIATANLGDMLDFFDFFLIGYVLAFIIGSWKLTAYGSAACRCSSCC
jgi:hypothetical protein